MKETRAERGEKGAIRIQFRKLKENPGIKLKSRSVGEKVPPASTPYSHPLHPRTTLRCPWFFVARLSRRNLCESKEWKRVDYNMYPLFSTRARRPPRVSLVHDEMKG